MFDTSRDALSDQRSGEGGSPQSLGPAEIRSFMNVRGFEACDTAEQIAAFHALADRLIPCEIASVATITAIQAKSRSAVYVLREDGEATGFLAFFAFSEEGVRAVEEGRFHGVRVEPDWVCPPSHETRFGYVWGFGGASRRACFAVIKTGRIMRDSFFPHIGAYARAATPDGRKVMEPLGYRVVSQADPGFYYAPPGSVAHVGGAS